MSEYNLSHYPYVSFANAQIPLLTLTAHYFGRLSILNPQKADWDQIRSGYRQVGPGEAEWEGRIKRSSG